VLLQISWILSDRNVSLTAPTACLYAASRIYTLLPSLPAVALSALHNFKKVPANLTECIYQLPASLQEVSQSSIPILRDMASTSVNGMSSMTSKQLQALLQVVLRLQTIAPCRSFMSLVAQRIANLNATDSSPPGSNPPDTSASGRKLQQQQDQQASAQVQAFDRQLEHWNSSVVGQRPRPSLGPALVALLSFAYRSQSPDLALQQQSASIGVDSDSPLAALHAGSYLAAVLPFLTANNDGGLMYKVQGILPMAEKCATQIPVAFVQDLLFNFPYSLPMAQVRRVLVWIGRRHDRLVPNMCCIAPALGVQTDPHLHLADLKCHHP
jgi:hypothetical protein